MKKKLPDKHSALHLFHPLVREWFIEQVGTPTDIQERAWPEIAKGDHVLITAPTGSGKTLTAFLYAINRFLVGESPPDSMRVLYISPLKALNNDIRCNLEKPLAELRTLFEAHGRTFPLIRTAVRSGDTDPAERREMMRHPPEIFITTPESLNILLSSKGGRRVLTGISTVILDEIHAVLPNKRGSYLITAVERLVPLCGEFQRIAISATVKPLNVAADFVGGYTKKESGGQVEYRKRRVKIVKSQIKKAYEIKVNFPEKAEETAVKGEWWPALTEEFRKIINRNRSSLFFANSRRMVEKVTRFINDGPSADRVYSHHGSLSKEIRSVVEKRFKEGELAGIISTSSLELGIDIGSVDQVILIQSPFSIASAVQRIGRSGHGVGQVSRGLFYPLHSRGFLEAAVIAANIDSEAIETFSPVICPLDVLAQVILSMTLLESRNLDELYGEIRTGYPFHDLKRKEFDLVVEMLAGRYADSRIRELNPRLLVDRVDNTAKARKNAAMLLYLSGGVIPDRGYFNLRVADTKAKIGELDEEFVWERSLGEAFPFGNQAWRIRRITHNDVEVTQVTKSNTLVPFWRAEEMNRSFHLSEKIGSFLREADENLKKPGFREKLLTRHHMSEAAADELIHFLKRQKEETGTPLPHRQHLLVEHFRDPANLSDAKQIVLHTLWGGRVNRPLALALAAAWEEKYKYPLEVFVNNDCIMLNLPHAFSAADILDSVKPAAIRQLLRSKLESTGYFGARFRENAQCALLLPRQSFRQRLPLWLNRLRSKKLLEAVSHYEDFPILIETWRQCMNREFEIDTLIQLLEEISSGEIAVSEVIGKKPSPFTDGVIWRQTNKLMYEGDSPESKLRSSLSDDLIKEVIYSSHLRPRFSEELIRDLQRKLHRVKAGYSPGSAEELLQWVKERLFIPAPEWQELLAAIERDHQVEPESLLEEIADRLYPVVSYKNTRSPKNNEIKQKFLEEFRQTKGEIRVKKVLTRRRQDTFKAVIALENLPRVSRVLNIPGEEDALADIAEKLDMSEILSSDREEVTIGFLAEWLRFYGPVTRDFLQSVLGVEEALLSTALDSLIEDGRVIADEFRAPGEDGRPAAEEICDSENVEILLRLRRKKERPVFRALQIEKLPLFLATYQSLALPGETPEDLQNCLENLFGCPLKAGLWEGDVLPARLSSYYTHWLDTVMRENRLIWFGCGKERVGFCFDSDYELFSEPHPETDETMPDKINFKAVQAVKKILSGTRGKMDFSDLKEAALLSTGDLTTALWELAWQGRISNDDYQTVRSGVMNRFQAESLVEAKVPRRRLSFSRWQNSRPASGHWFELNLPGEDSFDAIDRQELVKDRIRLLFKRYGILFREILWNELLPLRWGNIFPVLRLMELSGEIFTGQFFKGIPGLQFCTPIAFRILKRGLPEDAIYWMNAADPVSPCGIGLEELRFPLPHRLPTTHLVFHGSRNVLVSKKNGKELDFKVSADSPLIPEYLEFFKVLISRKFQPLKFIKVEAVNNEPVLDSPYKKPLLAFGFYKDYKALILEKSY